jgi:holliday junction DNA helicase RuvA
VIGWLNGHIVDASLDTVIVDVQGVGYEVQVASSQRFQAGNSVEFFVHTAVRADAIVLYGFESIKDRAFFELLLNTPGVGPSTALAALRTMSAPELAQVITTGDAKKVATIPGIGPKTASRIILELKDKVPTLGGPVIQTSSSTSSSIEEALKSLGYSSQEIRESLIGAQLSSDEGEALRQALQLVRKS